MVAAQLIGSALEKICDAASGRKYASLRQETKELLDRLPELLEDYGAQPTQPDAEPSAPKPQEDGATALETRMSTADSVAPAHLPVAGDHALPAAESDAAEAIMRITAPDEPPPAPSQRALSEEAAHTLLEILRQAIETRKTALVEVALDLIQRLIAHQALQGRVYTINHKRDAAAAKPKRRTTADEDDDDAAEDAEGLPPQAQAVELLCRCDDIADDGVELRVLKGLLTSVTSNTLHVHGQALLLAVRTCYNIFLLSKSEVNQNTAKASLTQIVNVVFQRMEHHSETVSLPPIMVTDVLGLPPVESSSVSAFVQNFLQEVVSTVDPFGFYTTSSLEAGLNDAFVNDAFVRMNSNDQPGTPLSPMKPVADTHPAASASEVTEAAPADPPADSQAAAPASEPHGAGAREPEANGVPSGASTPRLQLPGSVTIPSTVQPLMPAAAGAPGGQPAASTPQSARTQALDPVLQKDAFLVFRALCKLSIKTADASSSTDLTATRGKVLALELLKVLLENSGRVFASSEKFADGIKHYLCLSLLKNCASANPHALRLSCSIFLTLISKFRHSLKAEVGVFFPMILLRSIEPPPAGSTPPGQALPPVDLGQRGVVLRCLEALTGDGQLLVDLFVNYDCDLEGANLFERMVTALVRIAQTGASVDAPVPQQEEERALRVLALQCCVNILRSLVEWYTKTQQAASLAAAALAAAAAPGIDIVGDDAASDSTAADHTGDAAGPDKEAALLESWKAYKTGFQQGVALFNKKPKKGIAFMQEQGMLGTDPAEVAKFLTKTTGLEKSVIGEYLGEREDTALKVMHAYVDAMDFTGLDFDAAIRRYLDGFRLPGEAQKIDRLMEKFAERFVHCNPDTFKSADVAYVLAYSVIMLNTDAHNPGVKNKMSKEDFLRNNRGINDGGDLPQDFMEAVYDRIVNNEIKMKDNPTDILTAKEQQAKAASWMDSILSLIPGRKQTHSNEPSDEAIRRTHDYLRDQAKGATFFSAVEGETVRPMLDVSWAPFLGAFSVLFEEFHEGKTVGLCLAGFVSAIRITSLLDMGMLRNTFVTSLTRFTNLHTPASMEQKSAKAFRSMLFVAEDNGNHLHDVWPEVLRCISRFELLSQMATGGITDMALFAPPTPEPASPSGFTKFRLGLFASTVKQPKPEEKQANGHEPLPEQSFFQGAAGKGHRPELTPSAAAILRDIDPQELNRIFVRSDRLNSEAIVEFVRALCAVAREELRTPGAPRVYSLTKIVEIAHFNMTRIRLVWSRIWAVLADFFVEVGCHPNLQVAMYGVDSMRQLAMKFLERDELANFSFQNDFLKPFVVVMRQSKALEIRELIIRCVSQMVLARVGNVKSGWKSMFMVFTTAASDEAPTIVRLAFETIEKIVREHFQHITETETTTFTDCVNCLIAFTNNPHSLDVALNAIAFLRFCAMKLAEGDIGDTETLPEGTEAPVNMHTLRIQEAGSVTLTAEEVQRATRDLAAMPPPQVVSPETDAREGLEGMETSSGSGRPRAPVSSGLRFTDKDEHMYFWFPLLAGLSELTFDPRADIRYSALEVLFDTLSYHGSAFTPEFWTRIFDSVLLSIFDHVRAEVTDTTTFTDEARRAEVDAWLYDTCTQCLQHMVDLVVQFYPAVQPLLPRILDLLDNFIRRPHQSLAAVGVAALTRLISAAGSAMSDDTWALCVHTLSAAALDTLPQVNELVAGSSVRTSVDAEASEDGQQRRPSLATGSGARRLGLVRVRAAVQLLLVQACGEVHAAHAGRMPLAPLVEMLDTLERVSGHARAANDDMPLRRALAFAQADDQVPEDRLLADPPLLRLESEASHAYLSILLHVQTAQPPPASSEAVDAASRLVRLCTANLTRFQHIKPDNGPEPAPAFTDANGVPLQMASNREEFRALAPLVVATLNALNTFSDDSFRVHLSEFFPLLTELIGCEHAPPEVQVTITISTTVTLSKLFSTRLGPLLQAQEEGK